MSRSCVCVREKGEEVPMLDGLIDEVKEIVPRKLYRVSSEGVAHACGLKLPYRTYGSKPCRLVCFEYNGVYGKPKSIAAARFHTETAY